MPAETPLTARQQEIWQFLVTYVDGHGYPPTVREIGEEVGLASPSRMPASIIDSPLTRSRKSPFVAAGIGR